MCESRFFLTFLKLLWYVNNSAISTESILCLEYPTNPKFKSALPFRSNKHMRRQSRVFRVTLLSQGITAAIIRLNQGQSIKYVLV